MGEEFLQYAEMYGLRTIKGNKVLFAVDDYMMPEAKAGEKSKVEVIEHNAGSHYFMEIKTSNEGEKPAVATISICPRMIESNENYRKYINQMVATTQITGQAFRKPAKFFVATRTMDSLSFQDKDEHTLKEIDIDMALKKAMEIGSSNIVAVEVEIKEMKQFMDSFNKGTKESREPHTDCPFCKTFRGNKEEVEQIA